MAAPRMLEQMAAGFFIALAIALAAYRAGSLSRSGAVAATLLGAATMAAGWGWGTLLVVYFVASSILSHYRRREKERLTESTVEKGGARDAFQVVANGGVFALLAFASTRFPGGMASLGALGALAAAAADTWATEIGTLFGGTPRSVLTFRPSEPGTSGAVSGAGLMAMLAGATFIAYLSQALSLTGVAPVILVAGVMGAMADSVLGATVQERRWCASCERSTERRIHVCGAATTHVGGGAWINNDAVNLLATVAGAGTAVLGLNI